MTLTRKDGVATALVAAAGVSYPREESFPHRRRP